MNRPPLALVVSTVPKDILQPMVNITTGQEESIGLNFLGTEGSNITDVEMDTINMMRYIKDKYNISGGACHEMT